MDRQILNITANEQILTCDNPIKISTNKVNYIEAHFDLGDNWSGYDSVRAVWFNDFYCISTVLDSNGVCFVPSEVMKRNGKVKVNLVGSISENDVLTDRLTSYPIVAVIVDCTAQINGAETAPITPSQFEQYVAIVRSLVDSVKDIDHIELNPDYTLTIYYSDGTSDTTGSVRGADGNGIESVTKTGTSGLADTYTITYTDGQTTTFTVTNGAKGDTGNGIASIEKTSTVGLVDTYTITYTDGTASTFTVTNGEKGDKGDPGEVSLSELEDATVVQTLSDNTPYNYRRTNNGNGSGTREYDEIVGASVGWNQLVNTTDTSITIQSGHKYYSNINNVKTIGLSNGTAISINDGTKDNIIDLTLALGSTIADYVYSLEQSTAGSGVTWLRNHFPKLFDIYQPFDSGSIKSVSGLTAHEMVGKNLWNTNDISNISVGAINRNGCYFRLSGQYTVSAQNNADYMYCRVFNADGSKKNTYNIVSTSTITNATFSISGGEYFAVYDAVEATIATSTIRFNNWKCQVEFGSTATDFEPYEKHTYPLDSSVTLRGQYKLDANNNLYADGDVYKSDGTVTRKYAEVDLGSLDWSWQSTWEAWYTSLPLAKRPTASVPMNGVSDKYLPIALATLLSDHSMVNRFAKADASGTFVIRNGSDSVQPSGHLTYELATPTTEQATPYTNPQVCDPYGTEEYVSTSIVPIGHNTDYPMTLIDTMPTANGNYTMKLNVASGKKTITWQSV